MLGVCACGLWLSYFVVGFAVTAVLVRDNVQIM